MVESLRYGFAIDCNALARLAEEYLDDYFSTDSLALDDQVKILAFK
jgi:hypothetical protein